MPSWITFVISDYYLIVAAVIFEVKRPQFLVSVETGHMPATYFWGKLQYVITAWMPVKHQRTRWAYARVTCDSVRVVVPSLFCQVEDFRDHGSGPARQLTETHKHTKTRGWRRTPKVMHIPGAVTLLGKTEGSHGRDATTAMIWTRLSSTNFPLL